MAIPQKAEVQLAITEKRTSGDIGIRLAKKTLAVAEAELERGRAARREYPKSVPDSELDRLRLTVDRDQLAVEQALENQAVDLLSRRLQLSHALARTLRHRSLKS